MTSEKIYVELRIISEKLTPLEMSQLIGRDYDECWRIGEMRNKVLAYKDNGWVIKSGLPTSASMDEHINALLERVKPFAGNIRTISNTEYVLVACVLYTSDPSPGQFFEKEVIQQIAMLGANLDLDLYCVSEGYFE